jgi:hypothetical protein
VYLDGDEITPTDGIEIVTKERRSVLTFREIFPEDEGEYWVDIANVVGQARSTAYVTVLRKFVFNSYEDLRGSNLITIQVPSYCQWRTSCELHH